MIVEQVGWRIRVSLHLHEFSLPSKNERHVSGDYSAPFLNSRWKMPYLHSCHNHIEGLSPSAKFLSQFAMPLISRPKAGPAVSPAMASAATAGVTVTSLSHLTPGPGLVNARGRVHVVSGVSKGYPIQKIKLADGDYLDTVCPVMNQYSH